ncbi:response regulator transcription factor [Arthrobacter sp. MSA 4-2]|uniref:winged helix-turn-helix transcriptional regulator n=1 Tax=Arthrobacter sp. MSA 4-2 TaxID=2794349 RepID=UPI0018E7F2AE|nr:winged helix-turn-helix domain-containing protein [Arthrobacter sp. MSA 4-2]MBJ2121445.1 response regulator transcription factor [Arthrobacter sp. MSA 4-2]
MRWPCHTAAVESPSTPTCQDDPAELLNRGIELHRYQDGPSALVGIGASNPQIVIVPTDLTGIGVQEFVHTVVDLTGTPVLIGDLGTETSHRLGFTCLELGARGLIPLPATAEEIASAITRLGVLRSDAAAELRAGDLFLNPQSLRTTIAGVNVDLAPKDFEVLRYLMMEAPRVVGVEEISAHIRDTAAGGTTRTRMAIARTRKKLAKASPAGSSYIETVRGMGYRLGIEEV